MNCGGVMFYCYMLLCKSVEKDKDFVVVCGLVRRIYGSGNLGFYYGR